MMVWAHLKYGTISPRYLCLQLSLTEVHPCPRWWGTAPLTIMASLVPYAQPSCLHSFLSCFFLLKTLSNTLKSKNVCFTHTSYYVHPQLCWGTEQAGPPTALRPHTAKPRSHGEPRTVRSRGNSSSGWGPEGWHWGDQMAHGEKNPQHTGLCLRSQEQRQLGYQLLPDEGDGA